MKTLKKKLIPLTLCAVLILSACAPASLGLSLGIADPPTHTRTALVKSESETLARTEIHSDIQELPAAIEYNNCTHLYAIQPGDTLQEVARISATTDEFVLSRNDLESEDDLYPGLVVCLEDGNGGGINPPNTGERSGVEVTGVSAGESVAVRGMNFRAGEELNIYMFQQGISNPDVAYLGEFTIPAGGTFEREFEIPDELQSFRNLIIRFRNPDENISATATFINADVDRVTPDECAEYYTVRSGDAIGLIAQETNVSETRLVELNNLINANVVFPGQMLCIDLQ